MEPTVTWMRSDSTEELLRAVTRLMPQMAGAPVTRNARIVTTDARFFQGSAVLDDSYVVKFAWSEAPALRIVHEGRVLAALAKAGVAAIPTVVQSSYAPALLVTRLIPGGALTWEAANELSGERRRRLVDDLARFLAALHDTEALDAVRSVGARLERPTPQATTAELRQRFVKLVDPSRWSAVAHWCDWVDGVLADPVSEVLLHGDLHSYNLVWDSASGAIRAVVDFESAGLGDPCFDFRYLPGCAQRPGLFLEVRRRYEELTGRWVDVRRVMAWHVRTVLGDALWRTEAGVPLPGGGGTAASWVDELGGRMDAVIGA